jgi:YfiH family protein
VSRGAIERQPWWRPADWPAPISVIAGHTLRAGGYSVGAWSGLADKAGLNLGAHCGDDPRAVALNRGLLADALPSMPLWLEQMHGVDVWRPSAYPAVAPAFPPQADGAVSAEPGRVLAILSADCLPVLITDRGGTVVGAAHAGWRGLAGGVLEQTLAAARDLAPKARDWLAWMGPAIGPTAFEVGDEVLAAFEAADPSASQCFVRGHRAGKWFADLFGLARQRLARAGLHAVYGGGCCTVTDPARYYSYRRDRETGRMASLIWLGPSD